MSYWTYYFARFKTVILSQDTRLLETRHVQVKSSWPGKVTWAWRCVSGHQLALLIPVFCTDVSIFMTIHHFSGSATWLDFKITWVMVSIRSSRGEALPDLTFLDYSLGPLHCCKMFRKPGTAFGLSVYNMLTMPYYVRKKPAAFSDEKPTSHPVRTHCVFPSLPSHLRNLRNLSKSKFAFFPFLSVWRAILVEFPTLDRGCCEAGPIEIVIAPYLWAEHYVHVKSHRPTIDLGTAPPLQYTLLYYNLYILKWWAVSNCMRPTHIQRRVC